MPVEADGATRCWTRCRSASCSTRSWRSGPRAPSTRCFVGRRLRSKNAEPAAAADRGRDYALARYDVSSAAPASERVVRQPPSPKSCRFNWLRPPTNYFGLLHSVHWPVALAGAMPTAAAAGHRTSVAMTRRRGCRRGDGGAPSFAGLGAAPAGSPPRGAAAGVAVLRRGHGCRTSRYSGFGRRPRIGHGRCVSDDDAETTVGRTARLRSFGFSSGPTAALGRSIEVSTTGVPSGHGTLRFAGGRRLVGRQEDSAPEV